ncbi:HAD family hydrolase [Streptomyces malaysiensis]|uniref:HAD family hydrolase n=1 Tax=Streptomyces malaysiensis TaxID=92644 RepID=UPI0037100575
MQRLVLFDLDNTLVDRQGTLADWAAEFTARHCLEDEDRAYVLGMVAERAYPSTFDSIRTRYRLPMSTAELWREHCTGIAALVSCRPEVLVGLDELRAAGWRVGVATNGAVNIQGAKPLVSLSAWTAFSSPRRPTRASRRPGTSLWLRPDAAGHAARSVVL